jgi:4-hydroxy-tetrahydrodipicolinate reductase
MGRLVATAVAGVDDLELAACFDPGGGEAAGGIDVSADPAALEGCEVIVEFTTPDVVMDNLRRWRGYGASVVVGTSGFDAVRIAEVTGFWGETDARCLIVPNFSIGAVLMMRMAELAAPFFAAADIVELHHDAKVDAPSGTALATAQRMVEAGARNERLVASEESIGGATGAWVGPVSIHSVRLPGLVAHQQVTLGGPGETLTVRHDTTDRVSFMPGVLLAVRQVRDLAAPVTVGLEALLGLDRATAQR